MQFDPALPLRHISNTQVIFGGEDIDAKLLQSVAVNAAGHSDQVLSGLSAKCTWQVLTMTIHLEAPDCACHSHLLNAVWHCWDRVMAGLSKTFARVHTRMNCKSPLNTPLSTFALGQRVPSWTLRKTEAKRDRVQFFLDTGIHSIFKYLSCKSELKPPLEIFTHSQRVCRASVQQSIYGSLTIRHKQQLQLSKEQEHETVSGIHCMWSKGERSAQSLGLLGVILGVTILMLGQSTTDERSYARVGIRISTLKRVASRLNTSLEICAGLV